MVKQKGWFLAGMLVVGGFIPSDKSDPMSLILIRKNCTPTNPRNGAPSVLKRTCTPHTHTHKDTCDPPLCGRGEVYP